MASPDVAAATYTPEWRSRPIPQPGDHIRLVALIKEAGNHFLSEASAAGVVASAHLDQGMTRNDLLVSLVDDPLEYILRQGVPSCDWTPQIAAEPEPVAPAPEQRAEDATPIDSMSIVALERRLLAVQNRLAAIGGEEEALKKEVILLNEQIRTTALEQEMQSLPAVDGMTAYFNPVYYVKYKINEETGKPYTTQDVAAALKKCGHDYLLGEKYNGNQLRALVCEIEIDHKQPLPPALEAVLTLKQRFDVKFTPMGERKRRAAPRRDQ